MYVKLPSKAVHAALLRSVSLRCPRRFCHLHRRALRVYTAIPEHMSRRLSCITKQTKQAVTAGGLRCAPAQIHTRGHRTGLAFSNTARHALSIGACKAISTGQGASVVPDSFTDDVRLTSSILSDTEGSDEDEAGSALDVPDYSATQVDEAVTGYMQDGPAGTHVVKSKTEAHEQVKLAVVCCTQSTARCLCCQAVAEMRCFQLFAS